jgi:FKBP-type peptidyl-prolyl cis-trans isomerase SlyD
MVVENETVVGVHYTLKNARTGDLIEDTHGNEPLTFLYGVGQLMPDFESNLTGKSIGDIFDFTIDAANAYGTSEAEKIAMIPREVFLDENGQFDTEFFTEGKTLPMSNNQGERLLGTILEIQNDFLKMDFNHPLADTDLHFSGSVVSIRPADKEEIAHGHVHGPGGHHH